jgi:Flp pilus assembly protein TadD
MTKISRDRKAALLQERALGYTHLVVALLLIIITVAAYWRVLKCDFVTFDDNVYVTSNPHVLTGLTARNVKWAFSAMYDATWQPLVWLSYMLDQQTHGLNPSGYHLTNLLFHAANVLLLFLVLSRMTGCAWRSGFVAALFAIHPLHVESVAWIAERKDVLSAFFWLLTTWAYVRYAERRNLSRYLLVVCAFVLGLMSKPMVVTLPIVLLLMDYWPLERIKADMRTVRPLVYEKIPLFVLSAASCVVTYVAQSRGMAVGSLEEFPPGARIANALVAYVGYMSKTIVPRSLTVFYPHPGTGIPLWQVIGSAVLLACITFGVVKLRSRRYLLVGWLWYVLTLIPVIGLVQVGLHAMADRFTYIPMIGLFIAIAWIVPDLVTETKRRGDGGLGRWGKKAPIVLAVAACLVIAILAVCTWVQTGYWRNSITLFQRAVNVTHNNYLARSSLGLALQDRGETDAAVVHLREALKIKPGLSQAHNNLGVALTMQGNLTEAIGEFRAALKIEPDRAEAHKNLGIALTMQGNLTEAIGEFRAALKIDPQSAYVHTRLGVCLASQGDIDEALAHYRRALEIDPGDLPAHANMAVALYDKGEYAEAWKEVDICRRNGVNPPTEFLDKLSKAMADPGE